jgi:hypothetical protein
MKAIKYVLLVLFFASASTMMAVDYHLYQISSTKVKSTADPVYYYGENGPTIIFSTTLDASNKEKSFAPKNCFRSTSTMPRVGSSLPQAAISGVTTTVDHFTRRGPARIGGSNSGGGSGPDNLDDPWQMPIGDALLPLLLLVAVYVVFDMRKRRNQLDKQTE